MSDEIAMADPPEQNYDIYYQQAVIDLVAGLSRGEDPKVFIGPTYGMTGEQFREATAMLLYGALAMCAAFAESFAKERSLDVYDLYAANRTLIVPAGFGRQITIAPHKFVKAVRTMVRDGDNRIIKTVDE